MDRLDYAIKRLQAQPGWRDLPLEDIGAAIRSLYKGPGTEITIDEIVEASKSTVTGKEVYQALRALCGSPYYVMDVSWWLIEDGQPELKLENTDLVVEAMNTDRIIHPTTGRIVAEATTRIFMLLVLTDWDKPR